MPSNQKSESTRELWEWSILYSSEPKKWIRKGSLVSYFWEIEILSPRLGIQHISKLYQQGWVLVGKTMLFTIDPRWFFLSYFTKLSQAQGHQVRIKLTTV